jgi:Calcineurin-like phosphoesterase
MKRLPMVGWYDPGQLLRTGFKTLVSTLVGQRSDQRVVQALVSRENQIYDYTHHYEEQENELRPDSKRPREDLWIDFVCDTGDGFNSTYGVAYAVSQERLAVSVDGIARELPRADVLVFGGDEVYPTPGRAEYQDRLIFPYEQAFGDARPREAPHVFAIPGNHDWYDGLNSFSRMFCSGIGGRRFAGWRTRQARSYFALQLPGRWWLLGFDGALQSDVDIPQIEHFRDVAERHMKPGDRAIVCLSLPVWVYAHKYRQMGAVFDETDLIYLEQEILRALGVEVKVLLSGDLHHYRRHEEVPPAEPEAPVQKITAGGGGAFLHPTHDEDVSLLREEAISYRGSREFALRTSYPDLRQSRRLSWGNLLFGFKNPKFGIVPAFLYLMTVWMVAAGLGDTPVEGPLDTLVLTARVFSRDPALTLWVLFLMAVFVFFTDTHSRLYRWLAGLSHAGAHWFSIFSIGWGASILAERLFPTWPVARFAFTAGLVMGAGWIVGSAVMGLYLFISLNVFGRHSEHAFSALRIEDFKHFLRLHVQGDGRLTLYPIKIDRVPRRWAARPAGRSDTESRIVPEEPLRMELIEPPIVLRR